MRLCLHRRALIKEKLLSLKVTYVNHIHGLFYLNVTWEKFATAVVIIPLNSGRFILGYGI